jgi:hypothetical protein
LSDFDENRCQRSAHNAVDICEFCENRRSEDRTFVVMGVNEKEHALIVEPYDIFKVNSTLVKSVFTSRIALFAILYCGTTNEKLQFGVS